MSDFDQQHADGARRDGYSSSNGGHNGGRTPRPRFTRNHSGERTSYGNRGTHENNRNGGYDRQNGYSNSNSSHQGSYNNRAGGYDRQGGYRQKVALFVAPPKASAAPAAIIANKKATKVATIRAVTTNSAVVTRRVPATPAATMPVVTEMADTTARIKADTIAVPRAADSASPTPNDSIPANSALTTKRRPMIPTNPFASTSFSPMPASARVAMPTNTSKPAWFR